MMKALQFSLSYALVKIKSNNGSGWSNCSPFHKQVPDIIILGLSTCQGQMAWKSAGASGIF